MVDREIINEWIAKNEADKAFRSAEEIRNFLKAKLQL